EGFRVLRIQTDRLVIILNGSLVVAFALVDVAPAAKRVGIVRSQSDRAVEVAEGAVAFFFAPITNATIVEGFRQHGIGFDGQVQVPYSRVVIAFALVSEAPVVQENRQIALRKFSGFDRTGARLNRRVRNLFSAAAVGVGGIP